MSAPQTARPATDAPTPTVVSLAGHNGSLNGHLRPGTQACSAVEGQGSPQATVESAPKLDSPAGSRTGRGQNVDGTHHQLAPAENLPRAQFANGAHASPGTGEQAPPAAKHESVPQLRAPLADGFLALAADILFDLEKVRIANENRLGHFTRSAEDKDGEVRGFGLDESHPDVARLAALVGMLAEVEHKATLNLARLMRAHPLGPWVKAQKGIGEKQGARLLAAIGDPYIRPEIICADGTVEPSRPRSVSELWALCGYHVIPVPHHGSATQGSVGGGEQNGHPGHRGYEGQRGIAGVAPKRARGIKANWSGAAKMRAFLVAESCIKQSGTPYRAAYDATRAKYAEAVHATECVRCGPKGKPAQPGSPLSDGHKHARALRAVAKEVLRDLWREAKRLHEETPVSGHQTDATQVALATDGTHTPTASGEQNDDQELAT